MDETYNLDDLFKFQEWASQKSTQFSENVTSVGTTATPLPEGTTPCATPKNIPPTQSQCHARFLQEGEWNPNQTPGTDFADCLRYSIEWKVTLKGKAISRDTEPDVLLAPSTYWRLVLQAQLEELLQKKFTRSRGVRSEDTTVVVSTTERSQRDLVKRFDQTNIDWAIVENQLRNWGQYFLNGKRLRLNLSFNYMESARPTPRSAARKGDKRGSTSATTLMLAQRDLHISAEEEASGRPAVWQKVYTLFRCPGPCDRGPHCWIDPDGKKHYRLRAPHMRSLIEYVAKGDTLETHDDVPPNVRQQLYLEEEQRLNRKAKENETSPLNIPPINITNVLPGHSHALPLQAEQQGGVASVKPPTPANAQQLGISGFRDDALREYTEWQQSKVRDPLLKAEFAKARDAALKVGFDLEQIYEKQNYDFFVQAGVILGVAERFPRDILLWNQAQER
ncbi:hypothetical protein RBB50_012453 [Rhinocladiella similis]